MKAVEEDFGRAFRWAARYLAIHLFIGLAVWWSFQYLSFYRFYNLTSPWPAVIVYSAGGFILLAYFEYLFPLRRHPFLRTRPRNLILFSLFLFILVTAVWEIDAAVSEGRLQPWVKTWTYVSALIYIWVIGVVLIVCHTTRDDWRFLRLKLVGPAILCALLPGILYLRSPELLWLVEWLGRVIFLYLGFAVLLWGFLICRRTLITIWATRHGAAWNMFGGGPEATIEEDSKMSDPLEEQKQQLYLELVQFRAQVPELPPLPNHPIHYEGWLRDGIKRMQIRSQQRTTQEHAELLRRFNELLLEWLKLSQTTYELTRIGVRAGVEDMKTKAEIKNLELEIAKADAEIERLKNLKKNPPPAQAPQETFEERCERLAMEEIRKWDTQSRVEEKIIQMSKERGKTDEDAKEYANEVIKTVRKRLGRA